MDSFTRYFVDRAYQPTYYPGDRVFGRYHDVPFIGTVGNDTVFTESEGPVLIINVDLPLKYQGKYHTIVKVRHSEVKPLKAL